MCGILGTHDESLLKRATQMLAFLAVESVENRNAGALQSDHQVTDSETRFHFLHLVGIFQNFPNEGFRFSQFRRLLGIVNSLEMREDLLHFSSPELEEFHNPTNTSGNAAFIRAEFVSFVWDFFFNGEMGAGAV
jgi:hypothetical protein